MPHRVVWYYLWHSRFIPILWHSWSCERLFQLQMSTCSGLYQIWFWLFMEISTYQLYCKNELCDDALLRLNSFGKYLLYKTENIYCSWKYCIGRSKTWWHTRISRHFRHRISMTAHNYYTNISRFVRPLTAIKPPQHTATSAFWEVHLWHCFQKCVWRPHPRGHHSAYACFEHVFVTLSNRNVSMKLNKIDTVWQWPVRLSGKMPILWKVLKILE